MVNVGAGEVLIRAEAAGVGVGLLRNREQPAPGGEVVGRVEAVGAGVDGIAAGDRVGGVVFSGAYSPLVIGRPGLVNPIPEEPDAAAAVAVVRGGLVALGALHAGRAVDGESVLVTAAASGVGHLAVQLARALGAARVVAAAGSAGKRAFAQECGADEFVTYADAGWGEPVDLVLDGVGGELVQRGVDALRPFGRLVSFSAEGGAVDAGSLLGGGRTITGFAVGLWSRARPEDVDAWRQRLWALLADKRIAPRYTEFPVADLDRALDLVAARANLGRVVVRFE
ncbi:zinc-binding dehydrogenase [Dactylosporangium vinaceum]|uniref:Zinc-binding alcohol dehydrogenase family protein n=1 Tax=Dactylosporangium vinaceum TaxID=53362 RepID=A0ABV5LZY4_9ACTN|nr:zinc-binding dehydrogenase [Dactylosporangium vinaceum]UAB94376.1 zinc-binding dehydrogenase [Dactylosporangium vinaceum]